MCDEVREQGKAGVSEGAPRPTAAGAVAQGGHSDCSKVEQSTLVADVTEKTFLLFSLPFEPSVLV